MVTVDPVTESCLSVKGNGSAAAGLANQRIEALGITEILIFNFAVSALWLFSPKIDHYINQHLKGEDGYDKVEIGPITEEIKSNFKQDLPTIIFIFNFALLSTIMFAGWFYA